jgi:2-acylglycerol O-acyltransferase 2
LHAIHPHLDVRTIAATFCFYTPIYRDILLFSGVLEASSEIGKKLIDKNISLCVFPGGAKEAIYLKPLRGCVLNCPAPVLLSRSATIH